METTNDFRDKTDRYAEKIRYRNLKLVRRLMKSGGKVFEFGKNYNLHDASDVSELVERTSQFVTGLKIPSTVEATVALAKAMVRPHRKLIWMLLAGEGNNKAKILVRALHSKLRAKHFDEVQGIETVELLAIITMIMMMVGLVSAGVVGVLTWQKVKPLIQTAQPISAGIGVVSSIVKAVQDVCKEAYRWGMHIWEEIKKALPSSDNSFLINYCSAILFVMACYYVGEALGNRAKKFKHYLASLFGVRIQEGDEVQGFFSDPLYDMIELIRLNCTRIEKTAFWKYAWKLPKLTSMAKAIEYCCTHAKKIFYWIKEVITGKIHPYGPQEDAIISYSNRVNEAAAVFERMQASEILDPVMDVTMDELVQEKDRLSNTLSKEKKTPRPYFTNMMSQANVKLQQAKLDFARFKHMAKQRPVPVVVWIKGARGIGKSTIVQDMAPMIWEYLRQNYGLVPDRAFTAGDCFRMNQKENFWDGFCNPVFLEIDDIFQQTSAEVRTEVADTFIHMCSPSPLQLRMADPKAKGHTYFESKVILVTTNMMGEDFGASNLGIEDPQAFADRRTIVVTMTGPDEFLLGPSTQVEGYDKLNTKELVALIGQCVKRRDKEKIRPRKPAPPHQKFKFDSPRLKFDDEEDDDEVQCNDQDPFAQGKCVLGLLKIEKVFYKFYKRHIPSVYWNEGVDRLHQLIEETAKGVIIHFTDTVWLDELTELCRQECDLFKEQGVEMCGSSFFVVMPILVREPNARNMNLSGNELIKEGKKQLHHERWAYKENVLDWMYMIHHSPNFDPTVDDPVELDSIRLDHARFQQEEEDAKYDLSFWDKPKFGDSDDEVQSKVGEDMTALRDAKLEGEVAEASEVLKRDWEKKRREKGKEKETEEERAARIKKEHLERKSPSGFNPMIYPGNRDMMTCKDPCGYYYPWFTSATNFKACKTKKEWAEEWLKYNAYDQEKLAMFPPMKPFVEIIPDWAYYEAIHGGMGQAAMLNLGDVFQPCKDIEYWYTLPKRKDVSLAQDFYVYWQNNCDRDVDINAKYKAHARPLDDESIKMMYRYVSERMNHYNWWWKQAGLFFAGMVIVNTVLRLFMPASAYDKVQAQYDGNTTHRKERPSKAPRAPSRGAVRRMAERAAKEGDEVMGKDNFVLKMIAENYERIAVIEVPKGTAKDKVKELGIAASCWTLFVGGEYAIVTTHILWGKPLSSDCDYWVALCRNSDIMMPLDQVELTKPLGGDLALCRFPNIAPKKRITQHFAEEMPGHGYIEQLRPYIGFVGMHTRSAKSYDERIHTIPYKIYDYDVVADLVLEGIPSEVGDCGIAYVHSGTNKIVAIHVGGNGPLERAYANKVFRGEFEDCVKAFDVIDRPIPLMHDHDQEEEKEGDVVHALTEVPGLHLLGRVEPKLTSFCVTETKIKSSKFDMKDFPLPNPMYAPAMLKKSAWISPARNAYERIAKQAFYGTPTLMGDLTVEDFLPKTFNAKAVTMCTLEEAVYGIPGYMKSIDMDSSIGYWLKKMGFTNRRQLFFDKDGNKCIHPLVRRMVEQKITLFEAGVVSPVVYEDSLKDELRSQEKVDSGDTRLYCAGDLISFLVQRMVLGKFLVELTKDPIASPCGLAINPHSGQWGDLFGYLMGRPEERRKLLAGDFKNFDISLKWYLVHLFVYLVLTSCPLLPRWVDKVIFANFLGVHIFMWLVHMRHWGTASGSFITSMFNTFVNWFVHKLAFCSKYTQEEFYAIFRSSFVGDDSLVSVPEEYEAFNMEYLSEFFRNELQMTYTSCFKDDTPVTWQNATYLKRRFERGDLGMQAPLSEKTLYNMCAWSDGESTPQQMESIVGSLLLEAQHYGRQFYGKIEQWVRAEKLRLGATWIVPSYDVMVAARKSEYHC